MAVRLPLILSQPARRDATAVELIENIVAAALLLPKLDANLIGDISTVELGSTDHLCLQGLTRDVILASFLEMPTAAQAWLRLGQAGRFIDCGQTTEAIRSQSSATQGERRVFYFQLTHSLKVSRILDQCQELVAAQSVQLVSIQLGGKQPAAGSALPLLAKPAAALQTGAANGHANGHASAKAHAQPLPSKPSSKSTPTLPVAPASTVDDDEDWSSIDKLVDELDAMDL